MQLRCFVDTCKQTVIVKDVEKPNVVCPDNIVDNNDPGECLKVVDYDAPIGTDNCVGATTLRTGGLGDGAAFPVGVTTEEYETTDASGNKRTISFID
jgi:hypothetical protein